jgi:hypothetical protein
MLGMLPTGFAQTTYKAEPGISPQAAALGLLQSGGLGGLFGNMGQQFMMPAQTIPQMQTPTSGPAPSPLPGGGQVPQNLPFVNPNTINPMDGSLQVPQNFRVPQGPNTMGPLDSPRPERGGLGQFNPFNIPTIQY